MRWVGRLWRDDGRVKATPAGVAASLAEGVTRSTNLLRVGLEEQGLSRADRKRFESEACILECLLEGGTLTDVGVRSDYWLRPNLGLSTWVQYERWLFPVIQPNSARNVTAGVEVQFQPQKWFERTAGQSRRSPEAGHDFTVRGHGNESMP